MLKIANNVWASYLNSNNVYNIFWGQNLSVWTLVELIILIIFSAYVIYFIDILSKKQVNHYISKFDIDIIDYIQMWWINIVYKPLNFFSKYKIYIALLVSKVVSFLYTWLTISILWLVPMLFPPNSQPIYVCLIIWFNHYTHPDHITLK